MFKLKIKRIKEERLLDGRIKFFPIPSVENTEQTDK